MGIVWLPQNGPGVGRGGTVGPRTTALRACPGCERAASCLGTLEEALCWALKAHLPGRLPKAQARSQSLTSGTIAKSSRLN